MKGEPPTEQDGDDAREVGVKHPGPPAEHRHPRDDEPLPGGCSPRLREEEGEEGRVQEREGEGEDEVGRSECGEGARIRSESAQEGYVSP